MHILENEFVRIGFDEKTGAIMELSNKKTSYQAIRQPALGAGIKMLIPIKDHRNHRAPSEIQRLESCIIAEGKSAILRYKQINCVPMETLNIFAEIEIKLLGPEVSFSVTVENNSKYIIEELTYPCLGGLSEPEGEAPLVSQSLHFQGGLNRLALTDKFPNPGYWGSDWPTVYRNFPAPEVCAPFILLANGMQGVYIGVHSYEPKLASFVHEYKPGYADSKHQRLLRNEQIPGISAGFCVSVTRMPFVAPGEKITLDPVVISMFAGDWHEGIKPYQKWRKSWYRPVKRPNWLDDADCWMTLHINSPEGCCRYTYKELPSVMKEAKEAGVKVLQLIGWARGGQDGDEPYQDTDPLLGTWQELKDAIEQIEVMGIHVLLMCKFKWSDQSTEEYSQELAQHTLKDIFGNPVHFGGYSYQTLLQNISGGSRRGGAGMCHLSKGYRAIALREFKKILELKPSGILYDELANPMLLCFDQHHGHKPGACHHIGSHLLAKEFYQAASEKAGDEFLFAGEGPNDFMTQYYWGSYIRSWDGNGGEPTHTPAWKYMNPEMYTATCLIGFDDREMVNQCMTYGYVMNFEPFNFKGRMSDIPQTVTYAMQAQELRMKLKDYIWNGTFHHIVGVNARITGQCCEFIYSLFESRQNGKRAVVIANQESRTILDVEISIDGGTESFQLYRIGCEKPEKTDGNICVQPRSFCVLIEESED